MPFEVWKFRLSNMVCETSTQTFGMPEGARILSVQEQHGSLVLWAAVDPSAAGVLRTFVLSKSGRPLVGIDINKYVGTVQTHGSSPVWHVFEV